MAYRQSASGQALSLSTTSASRGLTVTMWIRLRADNNNYSAFFEHWGGSYANMLGLITTADGTSLEAFVTGYTELTIASLAVDSWYFAGVVVDTSGNAKAFISPANGGTLTFTSTASLPSYNGTLYFLTDSDVEWANGAIENVKMWSAALSNTEIASEQFSRSPVRTTNLWGWWPLLTVDDVSDHSGNGRNLTKAGSPTTEAGPSVAWTDVTTSTVSASLSPLTATAGGTAGTITSVQSAALPAVPLLQALSAGYTRIYGTATPAIQQLTAALAGSGGESSTTPIIGGTAIGYVVFQQGPDHATTTPVTTRASGTTSLIVAGSGIYDLGNESGAPVDNYSNTYTRVIADPINYPGDSFSGCLVWYAQNINGGANHTLTKYFAANGEGVIAFAEVVNGTSIIASSGVARPDTSYPNYTSGTVTTTGPAVLVCFFFGYLWLNQPATAAGWDTALSYVGTGSSIQESIFAREVSAAGTYSCTVTIDAPAQGAVLILVAVEHATQNPSAVAATVNLSASSAGLERIASVVWTQVQPSAQASSTETVPSAATSALSTLSTSAAAAQSTPTTAAAALTPAAAAASSSERHATAATAQAATPQATAAGAEVHATAATVAATALAVSETGQSQSPGVAGSSSVATSTLTAQEIGTHTQIVTSAAAGQLLTTTAAATGAYTPPSVSSAASAALTPLVPLTYTAYGLPEVSGSASAALTIAANMTGAQTIPSVSSTASAALSSLTTSATGAYTVPSVSGSTSSALSSVTTDTSGSSVMLYVTSAVADVLPVLTPASYGFSDIVGATDATLPGLTAYANLHVYVDVPIDLKRVFRVRYYQRRFSPFGGG